jgi:hypothetical protein
MAELVFHPMATHIERTCQAAAVFSGYHGDKMWDANLPSKYVNDQIIWSVQVLSKRTTEILQQDLGTSASALEGPGSARLGPAGIVKAVDDLAGGRR